MLGDGNSGTLNKLRHLEDRKQLMANILNYSVYLTESLETLDQSSDDEHKMLITDELDKLEYEYQKSRYDSI